MATGTALYYVYGTCNHYGSRISSWRFIGVECHLIFYI